MAGKVVSAIVIWYVVTMTTALVAADCCAKVDKLESTVASLTKQIMMQQLNAEEASRTSGDSGVKQVRVGPMGTRPYYIPHHIQSAVNAIHDHSQNTYTVGMGETAVVMNGVEFRTRHNDFPLKQPHKTSTRYQATEFLPYPDVPPAVLAKETVEDQIVELREWFKAWATQNYEERDYREYFKPVLCYLEGAWTQSSDAIEEPFESDRHHIDASTWWDLTEKIRFTAATGTKSQKENYSFLPMKIINLLNGTEPVFAQWNYRILCAPLNEDIPTMYLRLIDELAFRMRTGKSMEEYSMTRAARFQLEEFNSENINKERVCHFCLLDRLMESIPGMDNYQGDMSDNAFTSIARHYERKPEILNTAFYHRVYQSDKRGAMGTTKRNRGYSDGTLFMAQTSQEKIPSMQVTDCPTENDCTIYSQKWSYAIPLEILYMTPLYKWNPYNITITFEPPHDQEAWDAVVAGGRNGGLTPEKAYNGNRRTVFYHTPKEFFEGPEVETSDADTTRGSVGVLDPEGNVHEVVASGTRIFFPNIPGAGVLRARYPISPLHNDGSQILKELEALKDIVTKMDTYQSMYTEPPCCE